MLIIVIHNYDGFLGGLHWLGKMSYLILAGVHGKGDLSSLLKPITPTFGTRPLATFG